MSFKTEQNSSVFVWKRISVDRAWKRIKCFPFTLHAPEEFKNETINGQFGFVFQKNSRREITWLSWRHRFRKARFQNDFRPRQNVNPARFQNSPNLKSVFEKLHFRDALVWTVRKTEDELSLKYCEHPN